MLRRRRLRGWTSNQVWAPRAEYLEAGSRAPDPAAAGERPLLGAPDFHQITGFQHLLEAQGLVKLSSRVGADADLTQAPTLAMSRTQLQV